VTEDTKAFRKERERYEVHTEKRESPIGYSVQTLKLKQWK